MNKIKILFFATLRDYVGTRSVDMEIPEEMTVKELIEHLITIYPRLEKVRDSMMAAINREYAPEEQIIPAKAEIAIFPPVSGG